MPVFVEKEIIAPGRYRTGETLVRATPRRIRHWMAVGNRMLARRLQIPLPWEHQDDAEPWTRGHPAPPELESAGFLRLYFLDRDGHLWGHLEFPNRETAEYVRRHVRFVSPQIDERFVDETGRTWRDVIT